MNSASSQSMSTTERRLAASPSLSTSLRAGGTQPQRHGDRQLLGRRRVAQRRQPAGHLPALVGLGHQLASLLDDRPCQRIAELARGQGELERLALAALADRVDRLEAQHHRQTGERMRGQIQIGAGGELGRLVARLE